MDIKEQEFIRFIKSCEPGQAKYNDDIYKVEKSHREDSFYVYRTIGDFSRYHIFIIFNGLKITGITGTWIISYINKNILSFSSDGKGRTTRLKIKISMDNLYYSPAKSAMSI